MTTIKERPVTIILTLNLTHTPTLTSVSSDFRFNPPPPKNIKTEGSEASPVPLMESAALSMDSRAPMRQRHRPSAGGSDIEDGGSKTGMVGIFPGQDGYVDDEDKVIVFFLRI